LLVVKAITYVFVAAFLH